MAPSKHKESDGAALPPKQAPVISSEMSVWVNEMRGEINHPIYSILGMES